MHRLKQASFTYIYNTFIFPFFIHIELDLLLPQIPASVLQMTRKALNISDVH